MEINLENVELIKDRTGCTYAEAKVALEAAGGNVLDAIIAVEKKANAAHDRIDGKSLEDSPVFAKMKALVEKGNISKIRISKNGRRVVSIPVTVGVVGTVVVPWASVLAAVAAMSYHCDIELIDDKGRVIDIEGKVVGKYNEAKDFVESGVKKVGADKAFRFLKKTLDDVAKKGGHAMKNLTLENKKPGTGLAGDEDTPTEDGWGLQDEEEY